MQVKPQIPLRAKWNRIIVVGEAPGREEAETGKPFVGQAGKLLDQMLRDANISRRHTLIINPFQTRPPRNDVGYFFAATPYRSAPQPEFRRDLKLFRRTLTQHAPAIILAMGRTAGWAAANYTGSLQDRCGKILISDYGAIMFLYHPAYFLRGKQEEIPAQVQRLKLARLLAKQLL